MFSTRSSIVSCYDSVKGGSPGGASYFGSPELGPGPPAGKSGIMDGVDDGGGDISPLGSPSSDPTLDVSGA